MFTIKKRMEIAGAHLLDLPYVSKCSNIHGHNWIIEIYCKVEELNKEGMVVDFTEIKRKIHDQLDHKNLNNIEGLGWEIATKGMEVDYRITLNPTAERLAEWICNQIPECYKVSVQESEGNIAIYTAPGAFND